ncbi:MAG: ABC transporter substrate-binding protein [Egibacteraceae bacterium]
MRTGTARRGLVGLWAVAVALLVSACGGAGGAGSAQNAGEGEGGAVTLRLGYFPNLTHATAIVGVANGLFTESLGPDVALATSTFNAGPQAVEALFSNAIDATFIGPNPAINAFAQSGGEAIRIVAGATSGGAFLVVRPGIDTPEALRGTRLSSPQLGNTQDVALRAWLAAQGLRTDLQGGGDASILPQENAQILETFRAGDIDGAWVPEPWATRLINEGGGHVLVDEADLWPGGQYVTTHLVVRTEFLAEHPDVVQRLLRGHLTATDFVNEQPEEAKTIVNDALETLTGRRLADTTIDTAWDHLEFTVDPISASLRKSADDAMSLGLLDPVDLAGIYDLTLINEVLAQAGRPQVTS